MQLNAVSVDLSKSVFQLSLTNDIGKIVDRKRLSRSQFEKWLHKSKPIRLVMEGCATSHYWGRVALRLGHDVKILHASYVSPYVRRNKTDASDADALIRADADHDLFPIALKSEDQQALQLLQTIRSRWVKTRTACFNEVRGLFAEFGVVLPKGCGDFAANVMTELSRIPKLLHDSVEAIVDEILLLNRRIKELDKQLQHCVQADEIAQRILTVPGVGPQIAVGTLSRVPNMHAFKRGRSFSCWMGLTAKEHSSGQRRKLGSITKAGDPELRVFYIHGGRSALLAARRKQSAEKELTALEVWALETEDRIGHNKATVALANKMARIAWAIYTQGTTFDGNHALNYK